MHDAKHVELIRRLHSRTLDGLVRWEQGAPSHVYEAVFPDYSVRLFENSPNLYVLLVNDGNGDRIATLFDDDEFPSSAGIDAHTLLKETHDAADRMVRETQRKALGALDGLIELLGKPPAGVAASR